MIVEGLSLGAAAGVIGALGDAADVAIVNETFVRRYFGGGPAVGRRVGAWGRQLIVVGVAADSKYHELGEGAQPYFYVPLGQRFKASTGVALHVRTAADPLSLAPVVREAMRAIDPAVPSDLMTTLADYTSASWFAQQVAAAPLSALSVMALVLSAIGLYSLMAYGVARRRREIGVRIAVGASASDIQRLVLGRGMALTAGGLLVGGLGTVAGVRALSSLLFGLSPFDATALVSAVALLVAVGAAASFLPARAAARLDPVAALRTE